MDLLIQHGEVVTAAGRRMADVLCVGGRIAAIEPGLAAPPGATVLDATGRYVMPGFIDPHVHVFLPLGDIRSQDTYATAGVAALLGGATSLFDFVSPSRGDALTDALDRWCRERDEGCACDVAFHMAVPTWTADTPSEMARVAALGVTSFKVYLAYGDTVGLGDGALYGVLERAAQLDATVLAHCEDDVLVEARRSQLAAAGRLAPCWHAASRPAEVEALGVHKAALYARQAGARLVVAHLSSAAGLDELGRAGDAGAVCSAEVCPHHLLLDESLLSLPDFAGARYVCSPPLRRERDREALWSALADGRIQLVSSDHAPFGLAVRRERGLHDFRHIPNGLPGLRHRAELLYHHGVRGGRLTLPRMVELLCTAPARLYGLAPRKGDLAVGADADVVLFDPNATQRISAATHAMNVDYSAYEGWELTGCVDTVLLRGRVQVRGGRFVGDPAAGVFLTRGG